MSRRPLEWRLMIVLATRAPLVARMATVLVDEAAEGGRAWASWTDALSPRLSERVAAGKGRLKIEGDGIGETCGERVHLVGPRGDGDGVEGEIFFVVVLVDVVIEVAVR